MGARLVVGPPGSGRTRHFVELARDAAAAGRRVAWVTLPQQRAAAYARLVESGPLLGVEVLSSQQLAYRLLSDARRLRPLVVGTERLVLVAEAIREVAGRPASPGEARLFAAAVAEAKRHALCPDDVRRLARRVALGERADALEAERLAEVFEAYQHRLAERVDYDDVRALALAAVQEGAVRSELDVVVVDGFRELVPLELMWWRTLGETLEVHVSLPVAPAGWTADMTLPEAAPAARAAYRFANEVEEARWVLRALGRDLERGVEPRALAVIAAPEAAATLLMLADEHGVPLVDEAPRSLAQTLPGELLIDLLALPTHPTPRRLLAVTELVPLAQLARQRHVAGAEAISALARAHALEARWEAWRAALAPGGDLSSWSQRLVDLALAEARRRRPATIDAGVRELLLAAAQAAVRLGGDEGAIDWWSALLRDARIARRHPAGVALLDADRASGRRFERAYLVGATAGAFTVGAREDYFLPEDVRLPWDALTTSVLAAATRPATADGGAGLPRRQRDQEAARLAELTSRAPYLVVTAATGDRSGPRRLDPVLMAGAEPPPELPAGSSLEHERRAPFRPLSGSAPGEVGAPSVEGLRRSAPCRFRIWAEHLVGEDDLAHGPVVARRSLPAALRRRLLELERLDVRSLEALATAYPEAGPWLERHAEILCRLRLGLRIPLRREGAAARVDGVDRDGTLARLVRFTLPSEDGASSLDAGRRWNELIAARQLLRHPRAGITQVAIDVWPLLGERLTLTERPFELPRDRTRLDQAWERLDARWRAYRQAPLDVVAGHHCRDCAVADICRIGRAR